MPNWDFGAWSARSTGQRVRETAVRAAPLALLMALPALVLAAPAADAVELATGDILVVRDDGAGDVVHVDPLTGDRTRTTTSITVGTDPFGLAFDPVRRVVYKGSSGAFVLYQEDLATGIQSAISRSRGVTPTGSGPAL